MRPLIVLPVFLISVVGLLAQEDVHDRELWLGYIGSIRVADNWSIWQDYHFVPDAFSVARYGLTYKLNTRVQMTGGLGFVWTSTSFTDKLVRGEYRPWGQIVGQTRLGEKLSGQLRFRYDARFRQKLGEGVVLEEHMFYNRLRAMARVRLDLEQLPNGDVLHLNLMHELLYNAGEQVPNGIDQNRLYLLLGFTHKQYTLLGGYHMRMIPQAAAAMRYNHGLTIWFLHTIDIRHRFKRTIEEDVPLPHGG